MTDYNEVFINSLNNLKKKGAMGISMIEKAFSFAQENHKNQFRKSGLPYISHPVEVFAILEKMDFSADVLCSALLHDVVEDCGVSVEEIKNNFNSKIAQIVDAVTEIKPNETLENIDAEIKTYQKLVSIGKINMFAFYIKFADRLHNLHTIEIFPRYKQIEKVKQTQKFVIPLLKIVKSREFYKLIENECYKILSKDFNIENFLSLYKNNKNSNSLFNQIMHDNLTICINSTLTKFNFQNSLRNIIISPLTETEIKESYETAYNAINVNDITSDVFVNIPTFNIFFVFANANYKEIIFKLLEEKNFSNILKLESFGFDSFSKKEYFVLKNNSRTKFKAFFFSLNEYIIFRNGSQDGAETELIEEDFENEIIADFITVKTRSNQILFLPKGSTVLDFAFKIHGDLGFGCKYAHLNDSPAKSPIYTKLSDGDKVNLIVEEDANKNIKNIARLKWLTYVNNEKSKKILLKYFESLYE